MNYLRSILSKDHDEWQVVDPEPQILKTIKFDKYSYDDDVLNIKNSIMVINFVRNFDLSIFKKIPLC